jgi:hypothetical protein
MLPPISAERRHKQRSTSKSVVFPLPGGTQIHRYGAEFIYEPSGKHERQLRGRLRRRFTCEQVRWLT